MAFGISLFNPLQQAFQGIGHAVGNVAHTVTTDVGNVVNTVGQWTSPGARAAYGGILQSLVDPQSPENQAQATRPSNFPAPPQNSNPQQYYVLFGGMGTAGDAGPDAEKQTLLKDGIPADHIIVHDSPFPKLNVANGIGDALAKNGPAALGGNVSDYLALADPDSSLSGSEYAKLQNELQAAGVKPGDKLTYVGHSAGGQEAATMSYLTAKTGQYQMDTVVAMGTPWRTNYTPQNTRLVWADSPQDAVVNGTTGVPLLGVSKTPPNIDLYPDREQITLPGTDAGGTANGHGSYLEPQYLDPILAVAQGTQRDGNVALA